MASIIGSPQPSPRVGNTNASKFLYSFGMFLEGSSSHKISIFGNSDIFKCKVFSTKSCILAKMRLGFLGSRSLYKYVCKNKVTGSDCLNSSK